MQGIRRSAELAAAGVPPPEPVQTSIVAELQFEIDYSVKRNSNDLPSFLGREIANNVIVLFSEVGLEIACVQPHNLKRWTFKIVA